MNTGFGPSGYLSGPAKVDSGWDSVRRLEERQAFARPALTASNCRMPTPRFNLQPLPSLPTLRPRQAEGGIPRGNFWRGEKMERLMADGDAELAKVYARSVAKSFRESSRQLDALARKLGIPDPQARPE